jgi:E3 ubiquitin-protein ligase BRE1
MLVYMLTFFLICPCSLEHSRQLRSATSDVLSKLNNVIQVVDNLHLKHRQLAGNYQKQRDSNAWNKAEQKRLKGILYLFCG